MVSLTPTSTYKWILEVAHYPNSWTKLFEWRYEPTESQKKQYLEYYKRFYPFGRLIKIETVETTTLDDTLSWPPQKVPPK